MTEQINSDNKYYKKLRADPVKWAAVLERKRIVGQHMTEEQKLHKRAMARAWKENNREKVREHKRRDHAKRRDAIRAKCREDYKRNRENRRAKAAARYAANRDAICAKVRADRAKNPELFRESQRNHKRKNPYSWRLYSVRKNAKRKGVPCDLDVEWFATRIERGTCELSGVPFDLKRADGLGPLCPSVDRIKARGPYTKKNCRLILRCLNVALGEHGDDFMLRIFRAVFIKRGEISDYEDRMAA